MRTHSQIMLTPDQVLDTYYLEARRDLLELAALLDRYDAAVQRADGPARELDQLTVLRQALAHLAEAEPVSEDRTVSLLLSLIHI